MLLDYESATSPPLATRHPLRVAAMRQSSETLYAGELEIHLGHGLVFATGHALTLSVREFELLAALAQRIGAIGRRVREQLRGGLEAATPDRRFIQTHPGFGYRFQPQPPAGARPGGPGEGERNGSALSRDVHTRRRDE